MTHRIRTLTERVYSGDVRREMPEYFMGCGQRRTLALAGRKFGRVRGVETVFLPGVAGRARREVFS